MTFRIFVQVWCEVDPTLNVRVDRQTGLPVVENGDVLMRISPLGRFGVATALQIAGAEVTVFCLGDGHEAALRHALAAGANRALQPTLPNICLESDWVSPVAEWLREVKPDLVIADRIAGRLAARLGWAHLAGLDQLQMDGGQLRAIRHLGRGDCESVTAKLPAAIRLQTETPRLKYVSQARIAAVASRTIEQVSLNLPATSRNDAELGPLQISRPRTKLGAAPVATPASGLDRLSALMGVVGRVTPSAPLPTDQTRPARSDGPYPEPASKTPDEMAEEFVRYLAHHNLLND